MAKLSANGNVLVELIAVKQYSDGADADAMTKTRKVTLRAMSSGFVLKKTDFKLNYGIGKKDEYYPGNWKRSGKIKQDLMNDKNKLFEAMLNWQTDLRDKGWEAEISPLKF